MKNDENQLLVNIPSSRKISKSRKNSYVTMNRREKIRDKKMVYPESTLNKIVFVSNLEGNGFQRENIYLYDVPAHIDLQGMINGINSVCFNQWRATFQALQQQPLYRYELIQRALGFLALIIIALFVYFIIIQNIAYTEILAYIFLGLIVLGCICSFLLMRENRLQINKDLDMIKSIKRQLIKLNQIEVNLFADGARFTWTCHKDCLWIACQFH